MARVNNIISVSRNLGLGLGLAVCLAACSTVQENPNYQYSTKYRGASDTSYASNSATTTAATYTQASSYQGQTYSGSSTANAAQEDCRRKEGNREIIGGAAGGALGAFAGKKLIGGTGGTIAGAAIGGVAGYGLGDISVDCSPQPTYQPAPVQTYQQPEVYQPAQNANVYSAPSTTSIASPTDSQYANQSVGGTPGYQVYQGQGQTVQAQPSLVPGTQGTINPTTVTISGPVHAASSHGEQSQYLSNGAVEVRNYDYSGNLISADTAIENLSYPANETRILNGSTGAFQSYIVQPGDTVYGLSRKLCVDVKDIQGPNNINANYGINIGQSIHLPQNRC
ncbi:MAG: LysM domain-containing protein [Litorimonas sp.]